MLIYVDVIIVLNFLFDLLLLFAVAIILKRKTNLKRLIFGSLLGGFSILTLFIQMNSLTLFGLKIIISILMTLITFGYRDIRYTARNIFYLYTLSIILGGFLYLLNIEFSYKNDGLIFYHNGLSINFIVLLILSPIIIIAYIKQVKTLKTNYSNYYNVDIYFMDGKVKEVIGFVDTGNQLSDPYLKRPVILVDERVIKVDLMDENIVLVPYDTVQDNGLIKCIKVQSIYIEGVGMRNNVLVGCMNKKIKLDGVDCILNSKLLEAIK
ncbi:MAG: sigma-E processing peptidase SpoIIGA [bacterium]|nr:sigma-E processing peptidase SpoIIGA [bacterium]